MEIYMKVIGKMIKNMEGVNIHKKMATYMMENGKMI